MQKILKYIFSILLVGASFILKAQKYDWQGVSLGVDLSRIAVPFIDSTRYGWEISGQYEFVRDLYGVLELGAQTTKFKDPNYNYSSSGGYTRIGVDYNFMKHMEEASSDKMLIGIRYGFTTFNQEASNIRVRDNGWGEYTGGEIPSNWLTSNWIEVAAGMRTHLFNNFYLGWTVRLKAMIKTSNTENLQPYYIPGYGRGNKNSAVGINYSLYYMIPVKEKKAIVTED